MPDTEPKHQRLSDMISDALGEPDRDLANQTFENAEQLGKDILVADPQDANACYAIALTWYHRWGSSAERHNCIEWLSKTEAIDPEHPWVPLYLGYQYFDEGQFQVAFKEFNRVNREFFESIGQHWRNLKTDELALVCRIRGDFDPPTIASLRQLVSIYIAASEEDRAVPVEIVCALNDPQLRQRFDTSPCDVAREGIRLIEGTGEQRVFSGELLQLRSAT
jgi:tetratricopeptide (TPR) repeat protein